MDSSSDYSLLTLSDVDPAAQVISQAFVDDPLCAFMLPLKRTRTRTLHKFFRLYGEVNIQNTRGYGFGDPLQGVSSRLLRTFLEMADTKKVIAYTDTVTRSNVALYEHFGFQRLEEAPIAGTGITVWALRRPIQK